MRTETQQAYDEYLKSEHWTALRQKAIEVQGAHCQVCGNSRIQVHHMQYPRDWYAADHVHEMLLVLCQRCHRIAHGLIEKKYIKPGIDRDFTIASIKLYRIGEKWHQRKNKKSANQGRAPRSKKLRVLQKINGRFYSDKELRGIKRAEKNRKRLMKIKKLKETEAMKHRDGNFLKAADGSLVYSPNL